MTADEGLVSDDVWNVVTDALHTIKGVPRRNLVSGASIVDLELDSMDMIEVAMIVEERLGVVVEEEQLKTVVTLDDIVAVARASLPSSAERPEAV